jgi:ABC-2 type transport system permease protein
VPVSDWGAVRLYYEIARRAFRRALVYRGAYVAGILTNAGFGVLRSFVFIAVYAQGAAASGMTLQEALSYTWATQALISIGAGWIFGTDLMQSIRTGDVVTDLLRPWSFYGYWAARTLGERLFNLLVRGTLTYLIGVLYFGALVPDAATTLAFALTITLALIVSFAFSFLVSLSAFWLIDNSGIVFCANIVLGFFSGFLLPLEFFPAPLAALARALPFQAITHAPVSALLGRLDGPALLATVLNQAGWALVLIAVGLLGLRAAERKLVVQGG